MSAAKAESIVSWPCDHVTEEDILRRASFFSENIKKKTGYSGHILRRERYHFQRFIFQDKITEKKRKVGRRRAGIRDFQALQSIELYDKRNDRCVRRNLHGILKRKRIQLTKSKSVFI